LNTSQTLDRFGALSRFMTVGVILLDSAADLEFANPIACDLLGAEGEADARDRWAALKRQLPLEAERLAGQTSPMRFVVDFGGKAGTRSLRLEVHTLQHSECEGYLVLLRDRRAVDTLEANLLLASQMRSVVYVNRALAHDLRAPLNSMQLTLDLLTDSIGGDGESSAQRADQRERQLSILREELTRLNDIVRSVLDRGESLDLLPQPFDLRELVREANRLLGPQARRQRVEVELRMPERPVILNAYRDRIKLALINLTLDGLESMPEGGRLAIDLATDSAETSITVRGTGTGARSLDDVFRIHAAGGGAALGMYVARLFA
jgi:signal transduction histidine kinase